MFTDKICEILNSGSDCDFEKFKAVLSELGVEMRNNDGSYKSALDILSDVWDALGNEEGI